MEKSAAPGLDVGDAAAPGALRGFESAAGLVVKVAHSAMNIGTAAQFIQWSKDSLQCLLPHRVFICGVGRGTGGTLVLQQLISTEHRSGSTPMVLKQDSEMLARVVLDCWRARSPQLIEHTAQNGASRDQAAGAFRSMAVHGQCDIGVASVASFFCFAGMSERLTPRHAVILGLLTPHMHAALGRVLASRKGTNAEYVMHRFAVTARERDILHWLREGMSNREIAQVLGTSEHTVVSHVRSIFAKLGANNRVQAACSACRSHLLE